MCWVAPAAAGLCHVCHVCQTLLDNSLSTVYFRWYIYSRRVDCLD